ncbi:Uncharacterised protein [Chlamydia trachomatis]|nr:Uncharacterised protein [Chlamydia trachomatis]
MVFVGEVFGKKLLVVVVLSQGRDGVLLRFPEGDEVVGPKRIRKPTGHDGLVSAVRTLFDGGNLIDHQLRSA